MPEPDRLRQVLVQPERACDAARDGRRLERVRHPRPVVVSLGVDEDLRLALQTAERLRVDDPVTIALERRPDVGVILGTRAPPGVVRAHGQRGEAALLVGANALGEGVGDPSSKLWHTCRSVLPLPAVPSRA